VTANGIETSPVVRGVWMLENILGTPTPSPPDDVPAIDPDVRGASSIRDRLERHREDASCFQCHRRIDPLGFALEAFDPIGRLRTRYENKVSVDTAGQLPSGEKFADMGQLKKHLVERKDFFIRVVTENLITYGLGRRLEPLDRPQVNAICDRVASEDSPMRSLIEEVVVSEMFHRP
ncbi:MAG: DUF1588 domain-containing protein, partial [Planctomycetota bacterium]